MIRDANITLTGAARSRGRVRAATSLALVCSLLLAFVAWRAPVQAQGTTITLSPDPATIDGCETIQVEIWVNDVVDLYGVDFRLSFDPALLQVVDALPGQTGIQVEPVTTWLDPGWVVRNTADNVAGTIEYAMTMLNPSVPVSGSGPAVRIHLQAAGEGTASLHFYYTKIATLGGGQIPATAIDGSVATVPLASPSFTISRLNATDARLSWTAVPGAFEYHLYRATTPYFTPAAPALYSGTALQYDDAGALGDVDTNYYYVVRSACDNGFESANSERMGEYDYELRPSGYGDMAIVVENSAYQSAATLATYIGATTRFISRYNATTQAYQTYFVGVPFTNFTLNTGDYVFAVADASSPSSVALVGQVPDAGSVSFTLVAGTPPKYNYVSIPLDRPDLVYASDVAAEIGSSVALVSRYLVPSQSYETYFPGVPFTDFAIKIGEPFVLVLKAGAPPVWP